MPVSTRERFTCGCGAVYTETEWLALPSPPKGNTLAVPADLDFCNCTVKNFLTDGVFKGHPKECPGRPYVLTLRNCNAQVMRLLGAGVCNSTLCEEL